MRPPHGNRHGASCPGPLFAASTLLVLAGLPACYLDDALPFEHTTDAGVDVTAPPPPDCQGDAACDDSDPCTTDVCISGACVHDPAPAGTACGGDPNLCVTAASCDGAGSCLAGEPLVTDDGNPCTTDACDPATGIVTHTPLPGCTVVLPATGAPTPRRLHSAVWAGERMIVWGGSGAGSPAVVATGGRFDPAAGTWAATSTAGAPPARHSHCAVSTGDRMIVWGGFGVSALETTGGIYDPATDSWTATATAGAPPGRTGAACAWTGTELWVWGGTTGGSVLYSGGRYDPATGTWHPLPTTAGVPAPRYGHSATWAGDRVIVWGGNDLFDWHKDGAYFEPGTQAWSGATPAAGAPYAREQHTALWTGSRLLVWGGFDGGLYRGDGGSLDVAGNAWSDLSTTGAPSPRTEHAAVWTGQRMLIWGGCGMDSCKELYGDGGAYALGPSGGSWTPLAASPDVAPRRGATAVWTGKAMAIWGGRTKQGETDTGALIYP